MATSSVPECFSVVLVNQIIQDAQSGNYSMINVVENIGVLREQLGQIVPLEIHASWLFSPDTIGKSYELRIDVSNLRTGDRYSSPHGVMIAAGFKIEGSDLIRTRVRAQGFKAPAEYGDYELRMAWREQGASEWALGDAYWPFGVIEVAVPTQAT